MKRAPDNTAAAGLPAPPQFRSRWLRTILAGTALALATTAQALATTPQPSTDDPIVCDPEDDLCEYEKINRERCKEAGGTLTFEGGWLWCHTSMVKNSP